MKIAQLRKVKRKIAKGKSTDPIQVAQEVDES